MHAKVWSWCLLLLIQSTQFLASNMNLSLQQHLSFSCHSCARFISTTDSADWRKVFIDSQLPQLLLLQSKKVIVVWNCVRIKIVGIPPFTQTLTKAHEHGTYIGRSCLVATEKFCVIRLENISYSTMESTNDHD